MHTCWISCYLKNTELMTEGCWRERRGDRHRWERHSWAAEGLQPHVETLQNSPWIQILLLVSSHRNVFELLYQNSNNFWIIASLFIHLRTEKFSKAALFLFHMFHLLPNIRYFSWAAGTKEHKPSVSIIIDEGTYWVDLTRQLWGESESNIDRTMAPSLLSLYGEGVLAGCGKRVCPNFRLHKKTRGCGRGGFSVLEESHVVSESGQLLLIWNQWDWGRICGERRRSWVRGGFLNVPSTIHLPASPQMYLGGLQAHVFCF